MFLSRFCLKAEGQIKILRSSRGKLISLKKGSITHLMYMNKPETSEIINKIPELISQLLEPIQKPELTGDTFTKPNMSFCSLKPHSVTFDKEASIWLRE